MRLRSTVCLAVWLLASALATSAEEGSSAARDLCDVLGVTHVAGKYHLTDKPMLVEGADQIADLGTRVIKLYLTVPPRQYPFNTEWPTTKTLVDVARTPP